jgi:hypothetical protein
MILKAAASAVDARGVVGLFERFGWEAFLERPSPGQCGFWLDCDRPGRWLRVGLGGAVLCVARLPSRPPH